MLLPRILTVAVLFATSVSGQRCPVGSFIDSNSECRKCPLNTISTFANSTSCTPCLNRTAANFRQFACAPCGKGFFFNPRPKVNKVCAACPFNSFSDVDHATFCTPCPPGLNGPREGVSVEGCIRCPENLFLSRDGGGNIVCSRCNPGFATFEDQFVCEPCPPGTFNNRFSDASCRGCPPGQYAPDPGSIFCIKCPPHQFTNQSGQSACKPCPEDTEAPNVGARQCRPTCQPGESGCISCLPGSGLNETTGRCERCAEGFIGQICSATPCYPCPAPSTSNEARTKCRCPSGKPPLLNGMCDRPNSFSRPFR